MFFLLINIFLNKCNLLLFWLLINYNVLKDTKENKLEILSMFLISILKISISFILNTLLSVRKKNTKTNFE